MRVFFSIILLQLHTTSLTAFQLFSESKPNKNAEITFTTVDTIFPPTSQSIKHIEPAWLPYHDIEPSSFLASTIEDQEGPVTFTFFISRRVNNPARCDVVEFLGDSTSVTGIYNYTFTKINDEIYNDHVGYYNGEQFLSFVDVGDHGTWMVGNSPGVDDGIAYMRPKHYTLTPVGLENDAKWKWSESNGWKEVDSVRLICKDPVVDEFSHFYEVQGFRHANEEEPHKFILRSSEDLYKGVITLMDPAAEESGRWIIKDFKVISTMGKPQLLTNARGLTTPVALVSHEGGGRDSWRLTYRRIKSQLHLPLKERSADSDDFEWDYKSEISVKLFGSTAKLSSGYRVQMFSRREQILDTDRKISEMQSVNVGDYVWTWIRLLRLSNTTTPSVYLRPSYHESDQLMLLCVHKSKSTWLFRYYPSDRRDQMGQSVLERDTELVMFTLPETVGNFPMEDETCEAGRGKTPTQGITPTATQTQADQNATRDNDIESDNFRLSFSIESGSDFVVRDYQLLNLMRIGADPIPLIKNYILEREHALSDDISSCYLYHAGISIPVSFVYAAELLCVLMGAKPVTMIQYQSDSDASWKFPALSELVNGVISARLLLRNANGKNENKLDLQYQVWKYKNGEKVFDTLVIYRNASAYIAENILPRGTAQALHPMPFPDTSRLDEDHREQIYNAAWNGLLLGYPPRFVTSYCKAFQNDLPEDVKNEIYQKAHDELKVFLKTTYGKTIKSIQLGNDVPVSKEVWDVLSQVFSNRLVKF